MFRRLVAASLLTLIASACQTIPVHDQGDGRFVVRCNNDLSTCTKRAEAHCGDEDVVILDGISKSELYGTEGNQSGWEKTELEFACGRDPRPLPAVALPPRSAAAASAAPGKPHTAAPARVCTPGATQQCVGRGACAGGQACLTDGSGFGPCECAAEPMPMPGQAFVAPSAQPAPSSSAPAPAATAKSAAPAKPAASPSAATQAPPAPSAAR